MISDSLQEDRGVLQFPKDTGARKAALLIIRENNHRYEMIRVRTRLITMGENRATKIITVNLVQPTGEQSIV